MSENGITEIDVEQLRQQVRDGLNRGTVRRSAQTELFAAGKSLNEISLQTGITLEDVIIELFRKENAEPPKLTVFDISSSGLTVITREEMLESRRVKEKPKPTVIVERGTPYPPSNLKPGQEGPCLCRTCGEYFNGTSVFDMHRVGTHEYLYSPEKPDGRRCLTTEELLKREFYKNKYGRWCSPLSGRTGLTKSDN